MELQSWTSKKVGTEPAAKSPDIGSSVLFHEKETSKTIPRSEKFKEAICLMRPWVGEKMALMRNRNSNHGQMLMGGLNLLYLYVKTAIEKLT